VVVVETENTALEDLSAEELDDEIATLASHIYAGTCRWLELVAELDRRGAWAQWGWPSCARWLAWRCALTPRSAREHVRVARCLPELPLIREAFSCGELSYAKVRALTRVAELDSEDELLELARHMTASQLERAVRAYRFVTAAEANDLQSVAYVGYTWEADGSLTLRARLAPEDGALVLRALEAARDRLQEREWEDEGGSAEPRRATNAEAFVAMADMSLADGRGDRSGGERYHVVVHIDAANGKSVLEDGSALADESARRLACDASVVELVEKDGEPLSVGRKTRTIPPSIRRALQARDRTCRFPGCDNRRFLDAHHIEHWASGGDTKVGNLVLLCGRHHRFVHEAGYSIVVLADSNVEFRDSWGALVADAPRSPPGAADGLVEENRYLEIDSETCESGDGDRMDLALAVDALLSLSRRKGCRDP
jgi:hypothetical protein